MRRSLDARGLLARRRRGVLNSVTPNEKKTSGTQGIQAVTTTSSFRGEPHRNLMTEANCPWKNADWCSPILLLGIYNLFDVYKQQKRKKKCVRQVPWFAFYWLQLWVQWIASHVPTLSIKCSNVVICSVGIWRYELDIKAGCTKSSILAQRNAANTKCS